jgi:antitoxin PrlF
VVLLESDVLTPQNSKGNSAMATRYLSRVTQKGQVTIPADIRRELNLETGDRVEFLVEGGTVRISPARSVVQASFGVVKPLSRPEDFRAIREEIEQAIAEEAMQRGRMPNP